METRKDQLLRGCAVLLHVHTSGECNTRSAADVCCLSFCPFLFQMCLSGLLQLLPVRFQSESANLVSYFEMARP